MNTGKVDNSKPDLPLYAWAGVGLMLITQLLLLAEVRIVAIWLTPLMWSGYILMADGILYRLKRESWLTLRKLEFPFLFLLSVAIWLIFEIYNFRLQNWLYAGVPSSAFLRDLAYFWSFGTILPAVLISAEIIETLIIQLRLENNRKGIPTGPSWLWFLFGAAALSIPVALPDPMPRYLFGFIWLGFIFFVDPINQRMGVFAFRSAWRYGHFHRTVALLLGGLICGFLWEMWNYQAFLRDGGHWIYTIPTELRIFGLHYGQMPVLGLLGFPPFAIELYIMYLFVRKMLEVDRWSVEVSFFGMEGRRD